MHLKLRFSILFILAFVSHYTFSICTTPVVLAATITQPTCINTTGSVALSGLTINNWSLTVNPGGTIYTGNTTTYTISGLAPGTTYTISYNDVNGCSATIIVSINSIPSNPSTPIIDSIGQPTCINGGGIVYFTLPSAGTWLISSVPSGLSLSGTGLHGILNGVPAGSTNAFILANSLTGCVSGTSASVTMNSIPVPPSAPIIGTITQPTCIIPTGNVALSGLPSLYTYTVVATPASGVTPITLPSSGPTFIFTFLPVGTYTFTVTPNQNGCTSGASAQATIVLPTTPSPPIIGALTQTTCLNATGSINLTNLPTSNWTVTGTPGGLSISSTGPSVLFNGLAPGSYTFTVTNYQGCTSMSSSSAVLNNPPLAPATPVATITQPTCAIPIGKITVMFPTGPNYTYSIDGVTFQASPNFNSILGGNYTITVLDGSINCSSISSTSYTVNPTPVAPVIALSYVSNISCNGFNDGEAAVSVVSGGTAPFSYNWTPVGGTNDTATNLPIGTYNVIVADAANCIVVQSFTITEPTPLIFSGNATPIDCATGALGTISTQASGGTLPYVYSWSPVTSGLDSLGSLNAGSYQVIVTDGNLCADTLNYVIGIIDSMVLNATPPTTVLNPTFSVNLSVTGGVNYTWSPAAGLSCLTCDNPIASPDSSTTYYVSAIDANGCIGLDSIFVEVKLLCGDLYVPTMFSPNGVGPESNNTLKVFCRAECIKKIEFAVFDRWGEKVFQSSEVDNGWDGNFKGKPLPNGNFVYKLSVLTYEDKIINKSGSSTLVR